MASPTPRPSHFTAASKHHSTPHSAPHAHLQKPTSKFSTTTPASSSNATALYGAAAVAAPNSGATLLATAPTILVPRPTCQTHKNPILVGPASTALGPDFRRERTTRVISKRNLGGGVHRSASHHSSRNSGSSAASRCLSQLFVVGPEESNAIKATVANFRGALTAPEDYCYILRELGDRDKCPARAFNFFNAALQHVGNGVVDKGKLLTAAIGALGKMGQTDLAKRAFDIGIDGGYGNTIFAYSALISAYARSGLAKEAMGVLDSMKVARLRPTTVTYNAVIDACGKGGVDLHFTLGYFRELLQNGLCPDRRTFNSLLSACSRAGCLEDARAVFDEMIRLGIGQDIYTYNTFVDAVCKCGNMDLAVKVVSDMEVNNVKPNVVTYSTLMDGYSKLEQYDQALKICDKMRSLGIQLDRICYNTLLAIYVKIAKYDEIARVCEEMDAFAVDKDTVTYNSLINGYGKQGRFDIVAFLVQDMRARRVAPSVLTYSTLIDIYSKAGRHGDAANVFLEFKESGLKADVVLFSSFIDTLAKNGLVECALWLLDEMTRMGIRPNVVTYNTIIDAIGKARVFTEEDVEVEDMGIVGVYGGQIVRVPGHNGNGVGWVRKEDSGRRSEELYCIWELFQKMVQQGVTPNVVTFSAILNACSRCNSFEDSSFLLEQLRYFHKSYVVAHGLLMGYQEIWELAKSVFNQLTRMDSPTSSAFYNALTDLLWSFGQRQGAQQVVLQGVSNRVWENAWNEFSLDLHLMSSGAAQAMVHAWLLNVRSIVFQGQTLPEFLSILTGWGKHSKVVGASTLRRVIETLLNSIGAPFQVERCNIGRFISPGALVAAWLKESGTINILLLHDKHVQFRLQPSSVSNLVPSLQSLQL